MRCLYRIRRWDTDVLWLESRPLYKRFCAASLDADDLQFCGAAVGDEDWREIESLRICSAASEVRCGETKSNDVFDSTSHQSSRIAWSRICNSFIHSLRKYLVFCVFLLRLAILT